MSSYTCTRSLLIHRYSHTRMDTYTHLGPDNVNVSWCFVKNGKFTTFSCGLQIEQGVARRH